MDKILDGMKAGLDAATKAKAFIEEKHNEENIDGPGSSTGDSKESAGDNAGGSNTTAKVRDDNLPGKNGEAEVRNPGEEVAPDQVEYSLGLVFRHEACGKVCVMTEPKMFQAAIQNAMFRGNCPECGKPIEMKPKQNMVIVPAIQMPRNRHERRALGLVGPNGKRVV